MAAIKAEHKRTVMQKVLATSVAALMIATQVLAPAAVHAEHDSSTATPIKHVVVIFGENISFDHYFGTYPNALNPRNEPRFIAAPDTPAVNGYTDALLFSNPNLLNKTGNASVARPIRSGWTARRLRPRTRIMTTRRSNRPFTAA